MSWNEDLFGFINQDMANPGLDVFFSILIVLGTVYVWLVFVPALWWRGKRNEAVDLFFLILLVLVVTTLLKFLFAAPRPSDIREVPIPVPGYFAFDVFSFPSNHASRAFACASYISFKFKKWTVPLFLFAFLICVAKVYVGAHYPVDVIAGAIVGLIIGFVFERLSGYPAYVERKTGSYRSEIYHEAAGKGKDAGRHGGILRTAGLCCLPHCSADPLHPIHFVKIRVEGHYR